MKLEKLFVENCIRSMEVKRCNMIYREKHNFWCNRVSEGDKTGNYVKDAYCCFCARDLADWLLEDGGQQCK